MRDIYRELYGLYGDSFMREVDLHDEDEINQKLSKIRLSQEDVVTLDNLFFEYYLQWATAAFSLGIHLGLTLLCNQISGSGVEKRQKISRT